MFTIQRTPLEDKQKSAKDTYKTAEYSLQKKQLCSPEAGHRDTRNNLSFFNLYLVHALSAEGDWRSMLYI
jgi:hypothetical protein